MTLPRFLQTSSHGVARKPKPNNGMRTIRLALSRCFGKQSDGQSGNTSEIIPVQTREIKRPVLVRERVIWTEINVYFVWANL